MKTVKYKNDKMGGMPVHFPIGCKSKGAITHHKVANPFLELTDAEADKLVEIDARNFELASAEDVKADAEGNTLKKGPSENELGKKEKAEAKAAAKLPKKDKKKD